jgi:hypothetical protein
MAAVKPEADAFARHPAVALAQNLSLRTGYFPMNHHASHHEIVLRLKRTSGHLIKVDGGTGYPLIR